MSKGNNLNYQELSSVLAGLRILQDMVEQDAVDDYRKLPHFNDVEPLNSEQIDLLCERLNSTDNDKPEFLEGRYISEWEEGIVQTDATIDMEGFSLTICTVDCDYEHLEREYIEVDIDGKTTQLEVEDGELTEKGKADLTALFEGDS